MLFKKLSTFKFFLKIATFFKKKPNFEKQTCQKLDSFIFSNPPYFIFLSKEERQSMESAKRKHWKFELWIT